MAERETDSEHVFRFLLSESDRRPETDLIEVVSTAVEEVVEWCSAKAPGASIGLNVLLTDGERLVGTRLGRSLYWVHRHGVMDCEICGFPHVRHDPHADYQAVVVASKPLTHEAWCELPDGSVFTVSPRTGLGVNRTLGNARNGIERHG